MRYPVKPGQDPSGKDPKKPEPSPQANDDSSPDLFKAMEELEEITRSSLAHAEKPQHKPPALQPKENRESIPVTYQTSKREYQNALKDKNLIQALLSLGRKEKTSALHSKAAKFEPVNAPRVEVQSRKKGVIPQKKPPT